MAENSLPCSKSNVQVPNDEFLESRSYTNTLLVKYRHTWTIDNFSYYLDNDEKLVSPTFSAGINYNKSEWCLILYPRTKEVLHTAKSCIVCTLDLIAGNMNEIQLQYKGYILNAKGENVNAISGSSNLITTGKSVNIFAMDLANFKNKKYEYLFHDQLTIVCEIIYKIGRETTLLAKLKTPQSAMAMDFTFLLENKQLSDVTLCASGREFPAHKAILSVRSPVFRVMFQCDMEDAKNNWVEITDIDEEGLGEMLRYMYTGEINELEKMAPRLLGIAEKYDLEDLKMRCEEALLKNLSLENIVEMLILSDRFRAIELMTEAKKFIVANFSVIANSPEYYEMIKTYPYLGILVCTLLGGNVADL